MFKIIRSVSLSALFLQVMIVHAAKVSGVVTNKTSGDSLAGVHLILQSFNNALISDTAVTDAKGAYAFDGVSVSRYVLATSSTGYQADIRNVTVNQPGGSYAVNVALAPSNGGSRNGAISGTVKDDSTKEAIKNATVILSHPAGRGGPTPIDTVLTDGEGRFFFPVPAASNYIVTASASGYSEASENGIDAASRDTVRVPLTLKKLPKPSSAVVGKVTDAGTKEAINGADVILRRRTASPTGVQTWTNIDTVQSGGDGAFKFENLAASTAINPYSLLVSKADYNNATSGNIVVGNNQTDTANVALTKVAKGSMSIFVGLDSATNPALAGAAVAATLTAPSGEVYTGTTDAKGWVTFPSVIAGAYSVSANLDGYVSKVAARTVTANEKDTGYVYLARATAQNSKSLSGLVRDADGKAVQGAKVIFEGNGANGIVLAATSSATGDYAFRGIPTNVNGGTVTVQMNGFAEFTAAVTLTGAASFLNVTLKKPVSLSRQAREAGLLRFARSGSVLTLEFPAVAEAGSLSLYDARGVLVDAVRIPAGAVHAGLSAPSRSGAGFMILKQGASLRRLSLPAAP